MLSDTLLGRMPVALPNRNDVRRVRGARDLLFFKIYFDDTNFSQKLPQYAMSVSFLPGWLIPIKLIRSMTADFTLCCCLSILQMDLE